MYHSKKSCAHFKKILQKSLKIPQISKIPSLGMPKIFENPLKFLKVSNIYLKSSENSLKNPKISYVFFGMIHPSHWGSSSLMVNELILIISAIVINFDVAAGV